MSFWDSSFLWLEAVIASTAVAMACALVGVYTVLRRVVFLPAALSQISGLGVMLSLIVVSIFPTVANNQLANPALYALILTLAGALFLGLFAESKGLSRESLMGIAYIVASALVIVIGDRIPQEAHNVDDILFGNAVAVEFGQMVIAVCVSGAVIFLHALLRKPFLFISFDPETAKAHGVPVKTLDAILFLSMGLCIAVATKTIGAMPVFAFSVLPAIAALRAFENTTAILITAPLLGAASAFFGYWISFSFDFPTGACTVTLSGILIIPAALIGLIRRKLSN